LAAPNALVTLTFARGEDLAIRPACLYAALMRQASSRMASLRAVVVFKPSIRTEAANG
jgi:hypothetical protein